MTGIVLLLLLPAVWAYVGPRHTFPLKQMSYFYELPAGNTLQQLQPPLLSFPQCLSRKELIQGTAFAGALGLGGSSDALAREDFIVRKPIFSARVFDTARRSYLPIDEERLLHHKALSNQVVAVGEVHNDVAHHAVEYSILKATHQRRDSRPLAIGMEMFYTSHQPILDEFVFGSGTLAQLKADTKWDRTWGHKLSYYSKILNYAKRNGIRVLGLNVPFAIVKMVRQVGLEELPVELKRLLPEMDFSVQGHREHFLGLMRAFGGVHGAINEQSLERLYQAQLLWDEFMADSASRFLKRNENTRMLLLAGTAHIENRYGVPDRITRRLHTPVFTVAFDNVGLPEIDAPYGQSYADWLYFIQDPKSNDSADQRMQRKKRRA